MDRTLEHGMVFGYPSNIRSFEGDLYCIEGNDWPSFHPVCCSHSSALSPSGPVSVEDTYFEALCRSNHVRLTAGFCALWIVIQPWFVPIGRRDDVYI